MSRTTGYCFVFGLAWLGVAWRGLAWLGVDLLSLVWFASVGFGLVGWLFVFWLGMAWFGMISGTASTTIWVVGCACPSCKSVLSTCNEAFAHHANWRQRSATKGRMVPSPPRVQTGTAVRLWSPLFAAPAQTLGDRLWPSLTSPPYPLLLPVCVTSPSSLNYHTIFRGGPRTALVAAAAVKDAAGAPWACSVSPFVDTETLLLGDYGEKPPPPPPPVPIDKVARCEECFAYISPFSEITVRFVPKFEKSPPKPTTHYCTEGSTNHRTGSNDRPTDGMSEYPNDGPNA